MNVKDRETLNALLKKLSAVRVTLSDEEQAMLDWLIQGSHAGFKADEVHANIFKNAPQPAPTPGPDEVAARSLTMKPEASAERSPDEVAARSLTMKPEASAERSPDEVVARSLTMKPEGVIVLIYDPELEAYRYLQ